MTDFNNFTTEQEAFWSGSFGDTYTDRNNAESISRSNLVFWGQTLKITGPINSCFEIGCNRGLNLDAIKALLPSCRTIGLEINSYAAKECAKKNHLVFEGSILAPPQVAIGSVGMADLSIASGVLIHIRPENLSIAYKFLFDTSKRFILISEYFSPVPVSIPYRGHENKLFKRDFAGELWAQYPSLNLVDYGFIWSKDPVAPKGDITWFLFSK